MSKICSRCKVGTEFYANSGSICKICVRAENSDHRKTEEGKAIQARADKKRRSDPVLRVRAAARASVKYALRMGRITRQPCEDCGTFPAQAHHEDYSKPLEVNWLCSPCHRQRHKR